MPTYLRRFYLGELIKVKKEENKQVEKANKKIPNPQRSNIQSKFRR